MASTSRQVDCHCHMRLLPSWRCQARPWSPQHAIRSVTQSSDSVPRPGHVSLQQCGGSLHFHLSTARGGNAREDLRGQHLCVPGELALPNGELPRPGLLDTTSAGMGEASVGEALTGLSPDGPDFALPFSSMLPEMNHLQGGRIWSATSSPSIARFCITSPCNPVHG